jgi:fatty acid desaturase
MSSGTITSPTKPTSSRSRIRRLPSLRDHVGGWKTGAAILYALIADVLGLLWMLEYAANNSRDKIKHQITTETTTTTAPLLKLTFAILLAAHGRIVASYLVHEAAHAAVFVEPWANECVGVVCLWLAGCPYADFRHVRAMHLAHHKDRADTVEFDYRAFVNRTIGPVAQRLILALEWAFVPAVETIMHVRTACYPIVQLVGGGPGKVTTDTSRLQSACVGTPIAMALYVCLWRRGALFHHALAGALILHFLSIHDAFQHTYEAIYMSNYKPGPGPRTAQFEEENTFSNLISIRFPLLNLLSLNFGYHNAHHKKPMVPWYKLPELHHRLYQQGKADSRNNYKSGGKNSSTNVSLMQSTPQLLPFGELIHTWFWHRHRRVVDEDYGVVHPAGTPGRADDFVGSLGVSFLTV